MDNVYENWTQEVPRRMQEEKNQNAKCNPFGCDFYQTKHHISNDVMLFAEELTINNWTRMVNTYTTMLSCNVQKQSRK